MVPTCLDVGRCQRCAVVKFDAVAQLKDIGLAAVARFRHASAQIADEIGRRRWVDRVDSDQRAVKWRRRMHHRKSAFAMPVETRRRIGWDQIGQRAAPFRRPFSRTGRPCQRQQRARSRRYSIPQSVRHRMSSLIFADWFTPSCSPSSSRGLGVSIMPAEARTRAGSVTEGTGIAAPGHSDEIRLRCLKRWPTGSSVSWGRWILNNDRLIAAYGYHSSLSPASLTMDKASRTSSSSNSAAPQPFVPRLLSARV